MEDTLNWESEAFLHFAEADEVDTIENVERHIVKAQLFSNVDEDGID